MHAVSSHCSSRIRAHSVARVLSSSSLQSALLLLLARMSWYPLPVAKFATDAGKPAASSTMPFGLLPPTITQPLLPTPGAPFAANANDAAHTAGYKRPFDSAPQASGASAPPAAYASKFARSSEDASAARGGSGLGRGRGRGGMRGGMRGGRAGRDADPPAAPAAVAPHTPGFLADGRPDLSMYLTQPKTAAASAPAAQSSGSRAPPPAYAAAAAASSTAADGSAAAAPASNKPIYCQTYMQNLCFLRSCDAKDDESESAADLTSAATAPVGRCEFVHDPEFRRTYLARNQWRATTWSQNRKPDTQNANGAHRRQAAQRNEDDGPPKDGKLSGLKAPVKEDALLRKVSTTAISVHRCCVPLSATRFLTRLIFSFCSCFSSCSSLLSSSCPSSVWNHLACYRPSDSSYRETASPASATRSDRSSRKRRRSIVEANRGKQKRKRERKRSRSDRGSRSSSRRRPMRL